MSLTASSSRSSRRRLARHSSSRAGKKTGCRAASAPKPLSHSATAATESAALEEEEEEDGSADSSCVSDFWDDSLLIAAWDSCIDRYRRSLAGEIVLDDDDDDDKNDESGVQDDDDDDDNDGGVAIENSLSCGAENQSNYLGNSCSDQVDHGCPEYQAQLHETLNAWYWSGFAAGEAAGRERLRSKLAASIPNLDPRVCAILATYNPAESMPSCFNSSANAVVPASDAQTKERQESEGDYCPSEDAENLSSQPENKPL